MSLRFLGLIYDEIGGLEVRVSLTLVLLFDSIFLEYTTVLCFDILFQLQYYVVSLMDLNQLFIVRCGMVS